MTLMDGKRKDDTENYTNLYGEFKNKYQQHKLHTVQQHRLYHNIFINPLMPTNL
jgi:hypothetical protein